MTQRRKVLASAAWIGASVFGVGLAAAAQQPSDGTPVPVSAETQKQKLRKLGDTLRASEEQRRKLEADIEVLRADRGRLNAALIDTTAKAQDAESQLAATERRLAALTGSEAAIRRSLAGRRDVIAEVLAALQRMGRKPPPAVLIRPDDMLQAIRTSMLLGAVLPQLRTETEALSSDLADLLRLRQAIATERAAGRSTADTLSERQRTLTTLISARQRSLAETQGVLETERKRAAALADTAQSLRDLIAQAERQGGDNIAGAEAAEAARKKGGDVDGPGVASKLAALPFRDPARLAPQIAFADAKGMLPFPVSGPVIKGFGDADPFGGTEKGVSIAARPNAVVATPADGWVAFAGPYRSYGQVLIINAGSGYYVVLAGMSRINVDPRQFVLVGEPVAVMGDGAAKSAAAMAVGSIGPILYVEFRKDGVAVDPGSWWSKPEVEKVRG